MTGANLFLMAAPRAGSTQLARWLGSHPAIGLSPVKEPNHFSAHEFAPDFVRAAHLDDVDPARFAADPRARGAQFAVFRDPAHYAALFARLDRPWRCDASTSYLACPEAPALAAAACPGARAITLTRQPVERALSHYRLARRTGRTRRPLAAELEDELTGRTPLPGRFLLRPSVQAPGVARVAAAFGPDRHLALRFEDMIADPDATLGRIAAFLGLDAAGFDRSVEARNAGADPRFAALNAALLASGAKTRLRRLLPTALKPALRRAWFRDTPEPPVTEAERRALGAALAGVA